MLIRYHKERKISSGCYGKVYLATDAKTNHRVAIKQVSLDYQDDLIKEIHFMRALHQQSNYFLNIKQVIYQKYTLHLIMDYYSWTLCDLMEYDTSKAHLLTIVNQLLESYIIMEKNLICHFDLKPENILVDRNTLQIKLIDFGFADYYDTGARSNLVCTDYYRSPELFLSHESIYGAEIDLWSIGVILLEYFLGHHVFTGDTDEAIYKCIKFKLPAISQYDNALYEFDPDLQFIITGFVTTDISRRWATYRIMQEKLHRVSTDTPKYCHGNYRCLYQLPSLDMINQDCRAIKHLTPKLLLNSIEILEIFDIDQKLSVVWSSFYYILVRYLKHSDNSDIHLAIISGMYLVYQIFYHKRSRLNDFLDICEVYLARRYSRHIVNKTQQILLKYL